MDSGSANRKVSNYTGQHNTESRWHIPYLKWDSKPRSQFSSGLPIPKPLT